MARPKPRGASREWRRRGPRDIIDLSGERFGRLLVACHAGYDAHRRSIWLCVCDCKRTKEARTDRLRDGITTHCGCRRYAPRAADGSSQRAVEAHSQDLPLEVA